MVNASTTKLSDIPGKISEIDVLPKPYATVKQLSFFNTNCYLDHYFSLDLTLPHVLISCDVNAFNEISNASDMFHNCRLSSLALPDGFGKNIVNASYMFSQCRLSSLQLPAGFGNKITNAQYMFDGLPLTSDLTLPDGFGENITNAQYMFNFLYNPNNGISAIHFNDTFGKNIINAGSMFASCYYLKHIRFPDGFGQNITYAAYMLFNMTGLQSIHFPELFGQKITTFSYCFDRCWSLSTVTGDLHLSVAINASSCPLTHDSIMNIISSIQPVSKATTFTLGKSNLAKITDDEKKIATDKGWTLA